MLSSVRTLACLAALILPGAASAADGIVIASNPAPGSTIIPTSVVRLLSTLSAPVPLAAPGAILNLQAMRNATATLNGDTFFYTFGPPPSCAGNLRPEVTLRSTTTGEQFPATVRSFQCPSLQILLPPAAPLGLSELTLQLGAETYSPGYVRIVPSNFLLLDTSVRNPTGQTWPLSSPARPGDIIAFRGTGLGNAQPSDIHAELDGHLLQFAEAIPDTPGIHRLLFRIPASLQREGCYVPAALRIAGNWTPPIHLSVSPTGQPCAHPLQLTPTQLRQLDSGRNIALGVLQLRPSGLAGIIPPSAEAQLTFSAANEFLVSYWLTATVEEGCTLENNFRFLPTPTFDPGPSTLSTPTAASPPLSTSTPAPFPVLTPGNYRLRTAGSHDLRPIDFSFQLPPPPAITLPPAVRIPGELLLQWDPAPYQEGELITARYSIGFSSMVQTCSTRARNGQMRMPLPVLPDSGLRIIDPAGGGIPFPADHRLSVGVQRRKDNPLLFPFELLNGARYFGIIDYQIGDSYRLNVTPGTPGGNQ